MNKWCQGNTSIYFNLTWCIVSGIGWSSVISAWDWHFIHGDGIFPLSTAGTKYLYWTLFCNKKSVGKCSDDLFRYVWRRGEFSKEVLQCGRIFFTASLPNTRVGSQPPQKIPVAKVNWVIINNILTCLRSSLQIAMTTVRCLLINGQIQFYQKQRMCRKLRGLLLERNSKPGSLNLYIAGRIWGKTYLKSIPEGALATLIILRC